MKATRTPLLPVLALLLALPAPAAVITIVNQDGPGEGFNDPTVVAPVGGNPGTTLGQQRLNAFQHAADIWGGLLTSNVEIKIQAAFNPLTCDATSAVLGSAGAIAVDSDFLGAEFPATWYPIALANKLNNSDLDAGGNDINAQFNSSLGQTGCLDGTFWYLGFDTNHGTNIDLVTVLLHEFGHGLGFASFITKSTGALFLGQADIYARYVRDGITGRSFVDGAETDANRLAAMTSGVRLSWTGTNADTWGSTHMTPRPRLAVSAPPAIAGNYYVGTASFGPALTTPGITGVVVAALDPADGSGPTTFDACTALTNAAAVAGNIALVDRGTCNFNVKVKNCQNAGAIAVLVADNVAGVPPPPGLGGTDATITIPSVRLTQSDGALIRAQIATGVTANLGVDPALFAGMDDGTRFLLYAPSPVQGGSTLSHWDTSTTPNLLMEPAINSDLTHSVDATLEQMRDIGWFRIPYPVELTSFTAE